MPSPLDVGSFKARAIPRGAALGVGSNPLSCAESSCLDSRRLTSYDGGAWRALLPLEMREGKEPMLTEEAVLNALREVQDPALHRDLVSLEMVKTITVEGGAVAVTVELTPPACPLKAQVEEETRAAIQALPGVTAGTVTLTASGRKPPP